MKYLFGVVLLVILAAGGLMGGVAVLRWTDNMTATVKVVPGESVRPMPAGVLPRTLTLGLVYLSPVYFLMVFAGVRERSGTIAVLLGAVAGPMLHLLSPEWGVPATGAIGGTLAFLLDRKVLGRG